MTTEAAKDFCICTEQNAELNSSLQCLYDDLMQCPFAYLVLQSDDQSVVLRHASACKPRTITLETCLSIFFARCCYILHLFRAVIEISHSCHSLFHPIHPKLKLRHMLFLFPFRALRFCVFVSLCDVRACKDRLFASLSQRLPGFGSWRCSGCFSCRSFLHHDCAVRASLRGWI